MSESCIFFIGHGRRELLHFELSAYPTDVWLIEATPWDRKPRYLVHDRDRVRGADFSRRVAGLGIKSLQTPIQSPYANSMRNGGWGQPAGSASTT